MKPIYAGILNLLGFVLVIAVNALANILPINGYNTGQVSAFYPNYFAYFMILITTVSPIFNWCLDVIT